MIEVSDGCRLNGLAEKHGVNADALLVKLEAAGYVGRLAAVDKAERHWAQRGGGDLP